MRSEIYEKLAYLYRLWREVTLDKKGVEIEEVDFIVSVLESSPIRTKSIIDLGGGVGVHADLLQKKGYDVTIFDQSVNALEIAKKTNGDIKTILGNLESIDIKETFDVAICMWSTLSYVHSEEGRKRFYRWQDKHIKNIVILEEANFYNYSDNFNKIYTGENSDYKLEVDKKWTMKDYVKDTDFIYKITNKNTSETKIVEDQESEHYVSLEKIKGYFGSDWKMSIYGGYSMNGEFDEKESKRIVPVLTKLN